MRIDRCILVGLGGTGSILAEPLARLLRYHADGEAAALVLVDGDAYETGNGERQMFPAELAGQNKATVTARRLADALGTVVPYALEAYAHAEVFRELLDAPGHTLLVLAVDNHASYRAALDALDAARARREARGASELSECTVLRPGNGAGPAWGHVTMSAHVLRGGRFLTADPRRTHPEVGDPADRVPGGGCAAVAPSEPQRLAANAMSAAVTLAYVAAVLDGRPVPDEWIAELGEDARPAERWRAGPAGPLVPTGGAP